MNSFYYICTTPHNTNRGPGNETPPAQSPPTVNENYRQYVKKASGILPKGMLRTDILCRKAWGADAGIYSLTPEIVAFPETEAQVSQLLALASETGVPVTFRAAGTSLSGQSVSDSVLIVAADKWEGCTIGPGGAAIKMQPGVRGADASRALEPYGRRFTPDPASLKSAMVGGIVMNNASGMSCGIHANSDAMILSARIVLADGTLLDTGSEESKAAFRVRRPEFIGAIEELRDAVRADEALSGRIRRKYSIKNVTGLNLLPLVAHNDPFDIITHLMVGSEGTLGFVSEVTFATERIRPLRSCAMIYFNGVVDACAAVAAMKRLRTADGGRVAASAELLDAKALACAGDLTGEGLAAILTETYADTPEELEDNIRRITEALAGIATFAPVAFTSDSALYSRWWDIRSGVFPSVGGSRREGTTCLIEDVAFHGEDLPEAIEALRGLFARYGYHDACIYGHALEGNIHFILNQSFREPGEVARYENMMSGLAGIVVDRFGGSLKAEHGTGRNMAPFVVREWGGEAFAAMKRVKEIFDPAGILNPGVIFNGDPRCHVSGLKQWPDTHPSVDKCIECGFCEPGCLTCGMTLSSRQRIVVQREIACARASGDVGYARRLQKEYRYEGEQTCAGDGLCSTLCPMNINVAELTHALRHELLTPAGSRVWRSAAVRFAGVKKSLRFVLRAADALRMMLGRRAMTLLTRMAHRAFRVPLWTPQMPGAAKQLRGNGVAGGAEKRYAVYFPSCINQTMGNARGEEGPTVVEAMLELFAKAGYTPLFPEGMEKLCCGTIWESRGMEDEADRKSAELEEALLKASSGGKYPVLCDQSPCLYRMRRKIKGLELYEPVEFIGRFLADKLEFTPSAGTVSVHITCSSRKMGLDRQFVELARRCAREVVVPEGVGCCGFAGDKGFTRPEVNAWALRKLRPAVAEKGAAAGYSNSRTCEIGLSAHSGVSYRSIVHLVNERTLPKPEGKD